MVSQTGLVVKLKSSVWPAGSRLIRLVIDIAIAGVVVGRHHYSSTPASGNSNQGGTLVKIVMK